MDKICNLIKQANELIENENPIKLINDLESTINKQELEINKLTISVKNIDNIYLEQIKKLNLELESKTLELKQKNEEINNFTKFSIIQKVNKQLEEKNSYIQILESQIEKFKRNKLEPVSPKIIQTNLIDITNEKSNDIQVEQPDKVLNDIKFEKLPKVYVKELIEEPIEVRVEEQIEVLVKLVEESFEEVSEKQFEKPLKVPIKKQVEEAVIEKVVEPNKVGVKKQIEEPVVINLEVDKPIEKQKKKTKIIEEFRNDIFNPETFIEINGYQLIMYKKKYYLRDLETNQLYDIDNNMPNKVVGIYTINGKVKLNS